MTQLQSSQEELSEQVRVLLLTLEKTAQAYFLSGQAEQALQLFQVGMQLIHMPDALVTRLAELTAVEISRYGTAWAATEELRGPKGIPATDAIVHYLQKLCRFAIRAQAEAKQMYMWMAL